MIRSLTVLAVLLTLSACRTIGTPNTTPITVAPQVAPATGASISGGGLIGGEFGKALSASDRQIALNAEYKSLEYGKAGEVVDWVGSGTLMGKVKAAQPYRVGSQDCRQYSHEIVMDGAPKVARGTACRNNDGSWNLLD